MGYSYGKRNGNRIARDAVIDVQSELLQTTRDNLPVEITLRSKVSEIASDRIKNRVVSFIASGVGGMTITYNKNGSGMLDSKRKTTRMTKTDDSTRINVNYTQTRGSLSRNIEQTVNKGKTWFSEKFKK